MKIIVNEIRTPNLKDARKWKKNGSERGNFLESSKTITKMPLKINEEKLFCRGDGSIARP